ncbi:hemerythrin domain-containing protein [Actinocrinis puniceicyclus]|uniref:Hemerythrin domain-containing protein n=1 Tax=Actinocrinis puniceicyclus TaxID=977794 RepID=A0A8J8BF04_9ACTN|nr:hemerythrin domain-containing protein [Actinocrinis puniceicyclus]MBS2965691.1 hemerythrin domain-containing protein [Actinocrinis puniceicyclus]
MATRQSILDLVDSGLSYPQIGRRLGVAPGLAYLIATGLPADGGDAPGPQADERPGALPTSTQQLSHPESTTPQRDEGTAEDTKAWIRRRALADPALRAAWAAHGVAPPPVTVETEDLIDVIGQEHGQARHLQLQLQTLPGASAGGLLDDLRRRTDVLGLLRAILTAHEHAEEEVLWPLVRDRLPGGGSLARRATRQEHEAQELFGRIEAAEPASDELDRLVKQLTSALRKHVAFEDGVLGQLRERVGEQERAQAGRRFKAARSAFANSTGKAG